MINTRRAIVGAVFVFFVILLITRSHQPTTAPMTVQQAASPNADNQGTQPQSEVTPPVEETKQEIKIRRTRPRIDMSGMSAYDKLAYIYPYDVEAKFPAYIWQTWKYAPHTSDFQFNDQEASWTDQHPGFIHEVILDDVAVSLIRLLYAAVPEVVEAYEALPLPVLKADFFRYLILFARGGIYSDIDTFAIQSATQWIPENIPRETIGLVIGIEADPDRPDWKDWYSRRIQFCQWTIQSKPGHPVLRDVIAHITKETLSLKESGKLDSFKGSNVIEFTGPAVWTDIIMNYLNDDRFFDMSKSKGLVDYHNFTGMETRKRVGDVVILPITSFSPGVGQMGAQEPDHPMAFVHHAFEGTWKPESERHIGEQQDQNGQVVIAN